MMRTIYIGLALLLLIAGCNKNDDGSDGTLTVKINGKDWTGTVATFHRDRIEVQTTQYRNVGGVDIPFEDFYLSFVNPRLGRQTFHDANINTNPYADTVVANFGTVHQGGDVVFDIYHLIESDSVDNWIDITKESNDFHEIWGTFSANFIRVQTCSSSPYPDTLRFRDGEFHLNLK